MRGCLWRTRPKLSVTLDVVLCFFDFLLLMTLYWLLNSLYTVFQKRDTRLRAVTRLFNFFTVRFSNKFAYKYLLQIPPHLICVATLPCGKLMSENERQSLTRVVINDKFQGTVVIYLRCGGIVNNQINKGLLLSPSVFFFKLTNTWHSYRQQGGLCHALSSSFTCIVNRHKKVHETTIFLL